MSWSAFEPAHLSRLEILDCLQDFFSVIHHKGPIACNRFADRFASEEEKVAPTVSNDFQALTITLKDDEGSGARLFFAEVEAAVHHEQGGGMSLLGW